MTPDKDIVERLRAKADGWVRCPTGPGGWLLFVEEYREAADTIESLRAQLALSKRDSEALMDLLQHPAKPNAALLKAIRRHREILGITPNDAAVAPQPRLQE